MSTLQRVPTVKVTARINDQQGRAVHRAVVTMRLTTTERCAGYIVPRELRAETGIDGIAVLDVWPNALGSEESEYIVTISFPDVCTSSGTHAIRVPPLRTIRGHATVPNADCNLQDIMELPPYEKRGAGETVSEEVAMWAHESGKHADSARSALAASQAVETRINATAQTAEASSHTAQEYAKQAQSHENRAGELVGSVGSTIAHFTNTVKTEVEKTAARLTNDATTCISQYKASALESIDNRAGEVMSETTMAVAASRTEAILAVNTARDNASGDVKQAGDRALEALRDEAVLFGEDFENLAERAETSAKRAGCSAASAANSATKACECATRAESAAQGLEKHRDDALFAANRAEVAAECAKADAQKTETAAKSVEINACRASDAATEAKKNAEFAYVSAMAAAESAKIAHEAEHSTSENAAKVEATTADIEAAITEAAAKIVNDDVVNAAVASATAIATKAADDAGKSAITASGHATSAAENRAKAEDAATATQEIASKMLKDYHIETAMISMAESVLRLSNNTTRLEIEQLQSSVSGVRTSTEVVRVAGRVTELEMVEAKRIGAGAPQLR